MVATLTRANIAAALARAQGPVLVKFYSPTCPACQASQPMMDALAREFWGRAHVGQVNVDEENEVATRAHIEAIPVFVVYVRGQRVAHFDGYYPDRTAAQLRDVLNRALGA